VEKASGVVVVPEVLFAVSQAGKVAVFTLKKRAVGVEVTLTLAVPGTPELLTYDKEMLGAAGTGVTVNGLGGTTSIVICITRSGDGEPAPA
jgi:hypothetical protein